MKIKKHIFLLILSMILVIYAYDTYWVGFHNVDHCSVIKKLELEFNSQPNDNKIFADISESKLNGDEWDLQTCYLTGLAQIRVGVILFGIGLFLTGFIAGAMMKREILQ